MATNDRPARLALTAAVVAMLLGGAGTLVQQGFPARPGGTVAGVEVTGVPAVVHPAPEPAVATPMTRRTGGGADIGFTGGVPRLRIAAPAPPPGFAAVVVTADGTRLLPAAYDTATRSIVADLPRPGRFWGGLLDLAALGRDVEPVPAGRPDCAGRAASSGGVTVDPGEVASSGSAAAEPEHAAATGNATTDTRHTTSSGGASTDPSHATGPGSAAAEPGQLQAPVWVCVTADAGRAGITLTSHARVPYRIAVPPGWPESAARTGPPQQRDLLWPGTSVTYEVPFTRLPATLHGQPDPGAALGAALAAAAHRVATLFGSADGPSPAPDVLTCAAAVAAARYTADRPVTEVAADVWAALKLCHPDGGDTVRWFLAAGIGAVTGGTGPAFDVPITTSRAQRFTQTIEYRPKTGAATAHATGRCGAVSAVSGRHDAYRCTSGGTTYDPCFAGPEPRVVCLTSTAGAVLLTYTGGLPSPPQPGGPADPFLLTLADGLQCLAVAGDGYACTDGRTTLHGDVDTSSPMWTVDGRTVAKAYT
ncbi:hypothetical protein H4696_000769 [Amycolatopsis lexingtonensis]|uniref:Uncharacterized protein n=1 Tax=Amycolatopsis lexingtonensis TaxID=218822 RepID=A0ABR9HRW9_9PSEU|nr:hypothetical protein [Amycolatopsis lexingtonensis]MBE1493669.1 hypothetical protein [Amycolatopsis lexingtonensis]